jgi:putative tricarboxylic transport membrane protein
MRKNQWPAVPLILSYILGPKVEETLVQSLYIFHGDPGGFLSRPLAMVLLSTAVLLAVFVAFSQRRQKIQTRLFEDLDVFE